MKKQLIALRGSSSVGKSTSIHILYRLLISEPTSKALSYEAHGRKLDFVSIVEVDGYKIGLVNRGDRPGVLSQLLVELVHKQCDIIVCAARTRGRVGALLSSFSPTYQLVTVPKSRSANAPHATSNLRAAHLLASFVYAAIDA